jgi:hypothetical protein
VGVVLVGVIVLVIVLPSSSPSSPRVNTNQEAYKGTVTATVNGVPWKGDPSLIPLDEQAQVVLNLGGPVVTPPPINWSGSGL